MDDRAKLQAAMARMVACQEQIQETRRKLQEHGSGQLDANAHQVRIAATHLAKAPNVLSFRYSQSKTVDSARLRALTARAEAQRAQEPPDAER